MLIDFFLHLKARKLPVSTKEFLTLLEGLQAGLAGTAWKTSTFSRGTLVKDDPFDRFDQAFGGTSRASSRSPGWRWTCPPSG
jgi:uncharacterized protein with von Willebrand factor type A (vWA) domain